MPPKPKRKKKYRSAELEPQENGTMNSVSCQAKKPDNLENRMLMNRSPRAGGQSAQLISRQMMELKGPRESRCVQDV